ncbi:hypothetical protein NPIL_67241 [Nephila pilipes]|uniref:Uncharacterized protein n=1 Tax=Nephila pilipes TaxID=299642 RepID=A0A8X6QVV0_NEPPI|nr:hypothetical protein NPIL_67241 [Nephila pilipes]
MKTSGPSASATVLFNLLPSAMLILLRDLDGACFSVSLPHKITLEELKDLLFIRFYPRAKKRYICQSICDEIFDENARILSNGFGVKIINLMRIM